MTRDTPVFQAKGNRALSETVLLRVLGHGLAGSPATQATESPGIHQHAIHGGKRKLGFDRRFLRVLRYGQDHQANVELVFLGKLVIALIVRRHAHDGAGAVVDQDVIRHPDGDFFAIVRIDSVTPGVDAVLFDLADVSDFPGFALLGNQLVDRGAQQVVVPGQTGDQRMLRGELQRSRAVNGVDASREDRNRRRRRVSAAIEFEIDEGTLAAPDPVALHGADFFRPPGKTPEVAQQLVGVVCDAQKPLFEIPLLHQSVFVAPAASVDHLFVGQNRGAPGAPVHPALLAIGQAFFKELDEKPLVPFVVLGQASGDFTGPVVGEAKAPHLRLHGGNIAQRPFAGRGVVLDSGVLSRQSE